MIRNAKQSTEHHMKTNKHAVRERVCKWVAALIGSTATSPQAPTRSWVVPSKGLHSRRWGCLHLPDWFIAGDGGPFSQRCSGRSRQCHTSAEEGSQPARSFQLEARSRRHYVRGSSPLSFDNSRCECSVPSRSETLDRSSLLDSR